MVIIGMPSVQPSRLLVLLAAGITMDYDVLSKQSFFPALTLGGILWRPFINNLFWDFNSFDVGASFAGEVQNPERVLLRAMLLSVIFVVSSCLLPLIVAIGVSDTPQEVAGHLTTVAGEIEGPWLATWFVLASAVSNILFSRQKCRATLTCARAWLIED